MYLVKFEDWAKVWDYDFEDWPKDRECLVKLESYALGALRELGVLVSFWGTCTWILEAE